MMRRAQMRQAEQLVEQMQQAHEQIRKYIDGNDTETARELLESCQNAAISIGTLVEQAEGEGHPAVTLLEEYCELVYQIHVRCAEGEKQDPGNVHMLLQEKLVHISDSLKNDIRQKVEAVFLPYKASMWDSLESVWRAADADPECDAYVILIPYFDKNPDGSFCKMHYEADLFPPDVPITRYDAFDFGKHHPDMIFIHNPYDKANYVTSIHPFFYSDNLKKYTDKLIYIPYYATSGGMSEARALCPVYIHADYIVIQAEGYRKFFDARIPDERFLALGSPKFDSVINKCKNPPAPPDEWKEKMAGKKVYFYNTSISGMLADTDLFLKRLRYVFDIFKGRDDACLLWRPHPLLDATFGSLRSGHKAGYDALKKEFIEEGTGILDETADIETTIALSDVYIGDSGSSVTSLFSAAGKPLFIFYNREINTLPQEDDWRGEWIFQQLWSLPQFDIWGNDKYLITKNNQLWISEQNDYHYKFYMDLGCEYSAGFHYMKAAEIGDKIYVLPGLARHILIIENQKIRKVELEEHRTVGAATKYYYYYNKKYIFLMPFLYPYLVRMDIRTEEIRYIDGITQFLMRETGGKWLTGGMAPYENDLVFASPQDGSFVFMDMDTFEARVLHSGASSNLGTFEIVPDGDDLWLLPVNGMTVTCWNPKTGSITEYSDLPKEFQSISWPNNVPCEELPFGNLRICRQQGEETIVLSPTWGNMYLSLDRETGKMTPWEQEIASEIRGKNGYFSSWGMGGFPVTYLPQGAAVQRMWYMPERRLYEIDLCTKEWREIEIVMDKDEVMAHEAGFAKLAKEMPYALQESAFNSLQDFVEGRITGNRFDRCKQMEIFSKINANMDGTCGKNVYAFLKERL